MKMKHCLFFFFEEEEEKSKQNLSSTIADWHDFVVNSEPAGPG